MLACSPRVSAQPSGQLSGEKTLTWMQKSTTSRKIKPQTDVQSSDRIIARGAFTSARMVSSASCAGLHNTADLTMQDNQD